jgi:hypothetical protein
MPYIKSRWTANKNRRKKRVATLQSGTLQSVRKGKEKKKGEVDRKEREPGRKNLVGMVVVMTFMRVR